MSDIDPDDNGFDTNLNAIAERQARRTNAARARPDDRRRHPADVRENPRQSGYVSIDRQFAAGQAQYQPRTIEEKFYDSKK
jgi:hypothetical protein